MEINIVPISGHYLSGKGWDKKGFTWKLGDNTLTYDGCVWVLNGEEVQYTYEIENKLK